MHLITGEYPPDAGGVSDYTRRLAGALAARGDSVEVWAGQGAEPETAIDGVAVHRVAGSWMPADLDRLGRALDGRPAPRSLLVQYTPNAFGRRGMNIGFCRWLIDRRRRGDDIGLIFHEVRYLERRGDPLRRRVLALVQRWMARLLLRAASRVYVTVPYWDRLLEPHAPRSGYRSTWLPVPSAIPAIDDRSGVAALRSSIAPAGATIVGNFGTFHDVIGDMVAETLPRLIIDRPDRVGLLIGRGGETFAERLRAAFPEAAGRWIATGGVDAEAASRYLQCCDLVVQPYPDGVCTKRSSVMAALANGAAVATTTGPITEPIWSESGAVVLARDDDPAELVHLAESLLQNAEERVRLGRAGRDLHDREFSIDRLLDRLHPADPRHP
jgi:glycosyltransferase involved in cell wall biosynthesis